MNKLYEENSIQDIADAIREKNGSSDTYTVAQMGDAVRGIASLPVGTKCAYVDTNMEDLVTQINKISSLYTNMDYMFYRESIVSYGGAFPVNEINNWDVSNVTSMKNMFHDVQFNGLNLSNWNTSNVTNMESTFNGFINYDFDTLGLSLWDVSNVTNMKNMFAQFSSVPSIDLSSWNTSNVTDMSFMFQTLGSSTTSINLSGWDTSKVTNMRSMFANIKYLQHLDIRNFDFSNVTQSSGAFAYIPVDCEIIVKDQAAKDFILGTRSDLTNIVIA